ncbi:MAG TPA: hypothetical protein DIW47_06115 [Bacteroidetes bacterium]|nr:hypothetical protein [Bacteroidota bacterium]
MKGSEFLLLADSDVLIHFFRGNQLHILPKILSYRLCLLDAVVEELVRLDLYTTIEDLIGSEYELLSIDEMENEDIYPEFLQLISKNVGSGESACLATAKFDGHHIASSNLKDIDQYCRMHGIRIYTTMDLLYSAYEKELLSLEDCNTFVSDVISGGSKLPVVSFEEYLEKKMEKPKWTRYDATVTGP